MEAATKEWSGIKANTMAEVERLQQISNDLQTRFSWRVLLWSAFWFLATLVLGVFLGHYSNALSR
jgi:hypothetical protein